MNEIQKAECGAITNFTGDQLDLIKDTVCKGATDEEFDLFVQACRKTGLDPFTRQIHAVKRWDSSLKRMAMAIQTGIDGYRLIADRTGRYAPGRQTEFISEGGNLVSATTYVKKQTADGQWHEVSATAFYDEYVATKKDGTPNSMWCKMPRVMLSKCSEALALRRAFPNELSTVYANEEMDQADNQLKDAEPPIIQPKRKTKDTPDPFSPEDAVRPTNDQLADADDIQDILISVAEVQLKSGRVKYGLKIADITIGTFDQQLGAIATGLENEEVTAWYTSKQQKSKMLFTLLWIEKAGG